MNEVKRYRDASKGAIVQDQIYAVSMNAVSARVSPLTDLLLRKCGINMKIAIPPPSLSPLTQGGYHVFGERVGLKRDTFGVALTGIRDGIPKPKENEAGDIGGLVLEETEEQKLEDPHLYKVLILNDDYTPMEFVVFVIQRVFNKTQDQAFQIMLKIHHEGMGVCGIYSKDVAETKAEQVIQLAHTHEHPLQCISEKDS